MNLEPEMMEQFAKYFPEGFPGVMMELRCNGYRVILTQKPSPLLKHVNLFIWNDLTSSLIATEDFFKSDAGIGTYCTNVSVREDGQIIAYAAIGSDLIVDPETGRLTLIKGRPW